MKIGQTICLLVILTTLGCASSSEELRNSEEKLSFVPGLASRCAQLYDTYHYVGLNLDVFRKLESASVGLFPNEKQTFKSFYRSFQETKTAKLAEENIVLVFCKRTSCPSTLGVNIYVESTFPHINNMFAVFQGTGKVRKKVFCHELGWQELGISLFLRTDREGRSMATLPIYDRFFTKESYEALKEFLGHFKQSRAKEKPKLSKDIL